MEKRNKIIAVIACALALISIVAVCIFFFGIGKDK